MKEFKFFQDINLQKLETKIENWLKANNSIIESISISTDTKTSNIYASVIYIKRPL